MVKVLLGFGVAGGGGATIKDLKIEVDSPSLSINNANIWGDSANGKIINPIAGINF